MQGYFLLNCSYILSDHLTDKIKSGNQQDSKHAQVLMFSCAVIGFLMVFTFLGFQFYWFYGCALGLFNIIFTTVMCLLFYIIGFVKLCDVKVFRENANVFTISLVCVYLAYLSWASMASYPDPKCNPFIMSTANTASQIAVGLIFTFATILSISFASQTA